MNKGKVTILGVNGHIGHAAAQAFLAEGWQVTGMARRETRPLPGLRFVRGDSDSVADMRAAIGEAEVVVNALNLPYHTWFNGRMEAQMDRVREAVGREGRTLLLPASLYNFAAEAGVVRPETPQVPATPRGAVKMRVEQMFRAAAERGDMQVLVLRAGDFYGPGSSGDWFDLLIMRDAPRGRINLPGVAGVGHSWAYLPDLGRAFTALAALRSSLGAFEPFHFAGHFVTPAEMGAAIAAAAPRPVRVVPFAWWQLHLIGLVDPMTRHIARMGYLWRTPIGLADPRLESLLGPGFATPFGEAVAATVAPFFPPAPKSAGPMEPKVVEAV